MTLGELLKALSELPKDYPLDAQVIVDAEDAAGTYQKVTSVSWDEYPHDVDDPCVWLNVDLDA